MLSKMASTMASTKFPSLAPSSSLYDLSRTPQNLSPPTSTTKLHTRVFFPKTLTFRDLGLRNTTTLNQIYRKRLPSICFSDAKGDSERNNVEVKKTGLDWPILKRWDVPWKWHTVLLTLLACGFSFVLTVWVDVVAAVLFLGIKTVAELTPENKAGIVLVLYAQVAAAILGVLYGLANTFKPLPDDIFCYDPRKPFNLQKGWLLWAVVGLVGSLIAFGVTVAAMYYLLGKFPQREINDIDRCLSLVGSSPGGIACVVGLACVLAPLFEETLVRGFLMVSLTKWVPTPVAVFISAAVFALAHLTPVGFPQLFVIGTVLGFSYAQTHNLLTPVTIHGLWNLVILLLRLSQGSRV